MPPKNERDKFLLEIPLDVTSVEEFQPGQTVKVGIQLRDGSIRTEIVKIGDERRANTRFGFAEQPGMVRVALGPESASDEELFGMQTINLDVSPRQWLQSSHLVLKPIFISPYYWRFWLHWCRTFTIRGRVVCPDGNPAPGAKVCAYDVDWWWWWCSKDELGCATTDANGAFEIKFRWCCGWWPWWWWRHRIWHLEPLLADRIMPVLQRELKLPRPPKPDPRPDLAFFEQLLTQDDRAFAALSPTIVQPHQHTLAHMRAPQPVKRSEVDPAKLDELRERLIRRLPALPEFERLRLWPWWKWTPWWDCTPDIIFRVTQECLGVEQVIVDENCFDTRWDIPTELSVTLMAHNACCIPQCTNPHDCPEGECVVLSHACDVLVANIGGNPTAAPAPAGYVDPGGADRPFAGSIPIRGVFGHLAGVDVYEFEWSDDSGTTWNAMPPAASGNFYRVYWGPKLGTVDPPAFHVEPFVFNTIDGRRVVESREHFEATHDALSWGSTRYWVGNVDLLFHWLTENNFADGVYQLRLKAWQLAGDKLEKPRILPLCDTRQENGIVLAIDNRLVGPGSGHPTSPDHPCGDGTVHICTTEPDTDIIAVRVDGKTINACDIIQVSRGGVLEIDFLAHDPDDHLSHYTLHATYSENLARNLLAQPSSVLTPLAAAQVGPTYSLARLQGAPSPFWGGGTYRLRVNVAEAFPETCAYQLELRAYKRTIYNCDANWPHRNLSEYSFTVMV